MKKHWILTSGLCILLCVVGCGKSSDTPPVSTSTTSADPNEVTVDQVVMEFMSALKAKDHAKALSLLSPKAKEVTRAVGFPVETLGDANMQYSIKGVKFIESPDKMFAQVLSEITTTDAAGQPEKYSYMWALRKEATGWQVAGMANQYFPELDPILFNFEDAEDMKKQMASVREEVSRRNAAAEQQAGQPGATANSATNPTNVVQPAGNPGQGVAPATQPQQFQQTTPTQPAAIQQPTVQAQPGQQPSLTQQPVYTAQQPVNSAQQPVNTAQPNSQPSTIDQIPINPATVPSPGPSPLNPTGSALTP